MNKFFSLFFIFLFFSLSAVESEQIVVQLSTDSQLMPLYLGAIREEGAGLSSAYLKELEEILRFDLNHNGMTSVAKNQPELDQRCGDNSFAQPNCLSLWQDNNLFFVVVATVKEKKLSARALSVAGHSTKSTVDLSLAGNLAEDRKQMHKLADAIYRALFGGNGIASTRILYTIKNGQVADVWEADYDGGNARQITHENCLCVNPVYMPPKAGFSTGSFFYVSYQSGQPKIFVASLKEGKGRRVTYLRGNQLMPAISRQRNKLAFISDVTGNPDLFLQSFSPEEGAIGKPRQIFAAPHATQGTPTFHPDGSRIAFVSNKDGLARIYVMDIPAEDVTSIADIRASLITKRNAESTAPAWSPDGSKLAYSSVTNGVRQIWVHDFVSKQDKQLTQGAGNKENPVWGPNSLHILFNSTGKGSSELYLINLNQPDAVKITSGKGDKRFPSWEW